MNMTPEEALINYLKEWPALRKTLDSALLAVNKHAAKRARQNLSALSEKYKVRHELNVIDPEL